MGIEFTDDNRGMSVGRSETVLISATPTFLNSAAHHVPRLDPHVDMIDRLYTHAQRTIVLIVCVL